MISLTRPSLFMYAGHTFFPVGNVITGELTAKLHKARDKEETIFYRRTSDRHLPGFVGARENREGRDMLDDTSRN